jgi:hypothetical protein
MATITVPVLALISWSMPAESMVFTATLCSVQVAFPAGTKAIKQAATRSQVYFCLIAFTFKFESLERFQKYVPFAAIFYIMVQNGTCL